jgi:hypothetical protein
VQNRRNSKASEEFQSVQEGPAAHFEIPLKPAGISHSAHSAHFETGKSAAQHVGSPETPDFSNQDAKDYSLQKRVGNEFSEPPVSEPPAQAAAQPGGRPTIMTTVFPVLRGRSRWAV